MKKLKYILNLGTLILLTILISVSCTDGNDWETDDSYDRLFGIQTTSMSVSATATTAEVKWTKTPGTEYHIIEVSKDSLYNDLPMGSGILFGEDKSIVSSPATLTDLNSNSKYYIRIRAMSSTKTESRWTYPEKFFFVTPSEQIVTKYTYGDTYAKLEWEAGLSVTHLMITANGVDTKYDLTSTEKATGIVELTNLEQKTLYTIGVYNNDNLRGKASFTTLEAVSGPGVRYDLDGTEDLQAYLEGITDSDVILVLPAGSNYGAASPLTVPDNITSLTIWGLVGDEKARLNIKDVRIGTQSKFYFRIHNLTVEGTDATADYILNPSTSSAVVSEITFNHCDISKMRGVTRLRGSIKVNAINITNCTINDIGSYGVLTVDAATVEFGAMNIDNSTISNIVGGSLLTFKSKPMSVLFNHCTVYNVQNATGRYIVNFDNAVNIPSTFSINNSIFGGHDASLSLRATNPGITTQFVYNSFHTSDYKINASYPFGGITSYTNSSTDLFEDPATGNFKIMDRSLGAGSQPGDSRWW